MFGRLKRSKITYAVLAVILIAVIYLIFFRKGPSYQFVKVTRGSITEAVSVTGNTIANQSVSLSFNNSGIVSYVSTDLGKKVQAGQILAEQNVSELLAQLHSAEAGLIIAKQKVKASTNNLENITEEQNTLVSNAYRTLLNSTIEAFNSTDNTGYDTPTVTGTYECQKEGVYKLRTYSSQGGISVEYSGLEGKDAILLNDVPRPLGKCGLFLSFDESKSLISGVDYIIEIPNKRAPNYNQNYNAYQLALKTQEKAIAAAKAEVGVTDQSSVSDAEIAQANASVEAILAKIKNARIIAPISGTVTQFDAKVGQLASPATPLVSIMSDAGYEVDAGVSETDVGKIMLDNKVTMTLDAFQNETFTGKVFYIAPAETNSQGVVSYKIKVSFDKEDPRLKSGLTANLTIETKHKDGILILPQYAILQNDDGNFVQTLEDGKIVEHPITLGIQDQKGNVEIISGVVENEEVLNIGLKTQ